MLIWAERLSEATGRWVSWAALGAVLLCFLVVLLRYAFNIGWIAMQEGVLYLNSILFMMGAAYTLQQDGHVRVDILYRGMSPKRKAWVDLIGTVLFLLPMCVFILWVSWGYVADSWKVLEGSKEAGGMPGVYLLKSLIPIFAILLLFQGLSLLRRSWQVVRGIEANG